MYFDSSALVKLLLRERDHGLVDQLWTQASHRAINRLAYPEVRAGLAAAVRSERLAHADMEGAVDGLDELQHASHVMEIDDVLSIAAGDLAEEYALRGFDAVHLASALQIDAPRIVFATWDRALGSAAAACGCAVVPAAP